MARLHGTRVEPEMLERIRSIEAELVAWMAACGQMFTA